MISTHLTVLCSCFLIIYKSVLYKKSNRKKIFLLTICVGSDKVANEMEVSMLNNNEKNVLNKLYNITNSIKDLYFKLITLELNGKKNNDRNYSWFL